MAALQRRRRWQDEIGVAGGFVQVVIHRHHEFQTLQGLLQPSAVGTGQYRVAGHGDKRADLAIAGGEHFIRHGAGGVFAGKLRQPPDSAAAGVEMAVLAGQSAQRHQIDGGLGEANPTHGVKLAGQNVQAIHQPSGETAEGLGAGAHAAVQGRFSCTGQLASQTADAVSGQSGVSCDGLRCVGQGRQTQQFEVAQQGFHRARFDPVFREQGVNHGHQQQSIGAGADEVEFIRPLAGFGAPGVDHHQFSASFAQGVQTPRMSGTVIRLPLEATGLAPMQMSTSVWSRSGIGSRIW